MYLGVFDEAYLPQLKDLLRKQMRVRKRVLPSALRQRSEAAVFGTIDALGLLDGAAHILLYCSLPDELPTHATIERWSQQHGRTIYLPRVVGNELEVVPYLGADSLSDDNSFHIAEPTGEAVDTGVVQAVIVPGMAFDLDCHRMGRGKGYYDRLLSRGDLFTIGVGFDCQLVEQVPCERHDRQLHNVVTATHHSPVCRYSDFLKQVST